MIGAPACADAPSDSTVVKAVTVADMRQFLIDSGATVDKVETEGDSFRITATVSPERRVWVDGMDCNGEGEARACPEFRIYARWTLESAARAAAVAGDIRYAYTSVNATGSDVELWRMDFIPGGVTREHLRNTVAEFLELRSAAENTIWPPKVTRKPKTEAK